MLKKYCIALLCLALGGCFASTPKERIGQLSGTSSFNAGDDYFYNMDAGNTDFSSQRNFRVGVLLPLSGVAAKQGQGLKNSTMMALDDVKNPNLILQYYDTQSTPEGARIAIQNALGQQARMIVGPLMSTEVMAIADEASYRGVPVIAFSTSEEVLQPSIYTMGLLVSEQVDRIISYAAQNGRSRFALLLPDNSTGTAVAKAAVKTAQKNDVRIIKIGFYSPETMDFSGIISKMAGNGGANFDAVLIPETGAKLKSAVSMFAYHDIYSPQVQFLGTSLWEGGNLNKESTLQNAVYPALSRSYSNYFAGKYANLYGEKPSTLYSFGYDAIALASALSKQQNSDLNLEITAPDGYAGINGAFRLFVNGYNQHSLDVVAIKPQGDVVVEVAPKKFDGSSDNQTFNEMIITEDYKAPLIYGKDAATAQSLIYGQVLPQQNQPY